MGPWLGYFCQSNFLTLSKMVIHALVDFRIIAFAFYMVYKYHYAHNYAHDLSQE